MAVPALPNIGASGQPTRTDFRTSELNIISEIGGVYGTVVKPGHLDATNFVASGVGITLDQRLERWALLALEPMVQPGRGKQIGNGASCELGIYNYPSVNVTGEFSRWILPFAMRSERISIRHNRGTSILASEGCKVAVFLNGAQIAEYGLPDNVNGIAPTVTADTWAADEPYDIPAELELQPGDYLDLVETGPGLHKLSATWDSYLKSVVLHGRAELR